MEQDKTDIKVRYYSWLDSLNTMGHTRLGGPCNLIHWQCKELTLTFLHAIFIADLYLFWVLKMSGFYTVQSMSLL